jgi:hypothetical protein
MYLPSSTASKHSVARHAVGHHSYDSSSYKQVVSEHGIGGADSYDPSGVTFTQTRITYPDVSTVIAHSRLVTLFCDGVPFSKSHQRTPNRSVVHPVAPMAMPLPKTHQKDIDLIQSDTGVDLNGSHVRCCLLRETTIKLEGWTVLSSRRR